MRSFGFRLILAGIAVLAAMTSATTTRAANSYTVNNGSSLYIYEFSTCKNVTNSHASGKDLFVPTKTNTEWSTFYGNPPSGVSIANDTTAPTCSITGNPANPTTDTDATFVFSGSDTGCGVDHYECNLDSGGWSTCTSSKYYSGLSVAAHNFKVRAHDLAGNVQASPADYDWTIDPACSQFNQACIGGGGMCCAGMYCNAVMGGAGTCAMQFGSNAGPCDNSGNTWDAQCANPAEVCCLIGATCDLPGLCPLF